MGHSGQVGGSLQQGCYPPTSDSSLNSFSLFSLFFLLSLLASPPPAIKVHPHIQAWFWLAASLLIKLLLEAHFQLSVLWPQSRIFAPFESGLSVHRHTEPNLYHTGGVKGITMGQCKKKKKKGKWNNAETTQEQHREEKNEEEGREVKQNTRVHKCRKLWESILIYLPLCLYAW